MRKIILSSLLMLATCQCARAQNWRPLSTAPRDGTTIEIMNTYGVAPSYGLFKWSKTQETGGPQDQTKQCNAPAPYEWPQYKNLHTLPPSFDADWNKWSKEHCHDTPERTILLDRPAWVGVNQLGIQVNCSDNNCQWRPYDGKPESYVDPTGGAQNTEAYWRHAVGLP